VDANSSRVASETPSAAPLNSALGLMKHSRWHAYGLSSLGAVALVVWLSPLPFSGAGPFASMPSVRAGAIIGDIASYFCALLLVYTIAAWTAKIRSPLLQSAVSSTFILTAGIAVLHAPLLATALVTLACHVPALCPDSANPTIWAYNALVTSLPVAPVVVGSALAYFAYRSGTGRVER
jgi:hypothetical protein